MNEPERPSETTRCGFIALVGAPNAGKSTLLNSLVGTKVSIVTHKAQTTRSQIRGVVTEGDDQIVFIDTPGIFAPKRRLDRAMVGAAWTGAGDADIVALIVDVERGITPEVDALLDGLDNINHPRVLVLNKIDLIPHEKLLGLSETINCASEVRGDVHDLGNEGARRKGFPRLDPRAHPARPLALPGGSPHRPDARDHRRPR